MASSTDAMAELLDAETELAAVVADMSWPWRPPAGYWPRARRWTQALRTLSAQTPLATFATPAPAEPPVWLSRPIFVVGAPRSGTTLVRDLLDGHPQLVTIPVESSYYAFLRHRFRHLSRDERILAVAIEWVFLLATGHARPPFFLLGRSRSDDSPSLRFVLSVVSWAKARIAAGRPEDAACLEAFALALAPSAEGSQRSGWVEKTPGNEARAARLLEIFPMAKILQVVRNPGAVLRSRAALERAVGAGDWRVVAGCLELRRAYRAALDGPRTWPGRYLAPLRYEDLVADREPTVRQLAEDLDLDWHESLLQPSRRGAPIGSNSSLGRATAAEDDEARHLGELSHRHVAALASALGYRVPLPDRALVRRTSPLLGLLERLRYGIPGMVRRIGSRIG